MTSRVPAAPQAIYRTESPLHPWRRHVTLQSFHIDDPPKKLKWKVRQMHLAPAEATADLTSRIQSMSLPN
jgi:hypothetical protein